MSDNQPTEYDAVLGGGNQAPVDGVVLGGIEGVRRRLRNPDVKARITGLYQALNYGEAGLDLVIQALWDDEKQVQTIAYSLLKQKKEPAELEILQNYSDYYQFFDCISTLEEYDSEAHSVCMAPDGKTIIIGSENCVIAWEWQKKQVQKILTSTGNLPSDYYEAIILVHVNLNRESIFTLNRWGIIKELNWPNVYSQKTLNFKDKELYNYLIFDRRGQNLFTANTKANIEIWNSQCQKYRCLFKGHRRSILSLAVHRNFLFSSSLDKTIKIWDWQKEELICTLENHSFRVKALCLTRDGKTLFSGSGDGTIKVWDWQKAELIHNLKGHSSYYGINSLAISSDGKTLISASNDKTIKVWNWKTGKLQATLTGHSAEVNSIVLSPDGKYLFSGSHDKTVKVWGLEE